MVADKPAPAHPRRAPRLMKCGASFCYVMRMPSTGREFPLYAAWVVALLATVGSLFFSEVMGLPPCALCWYQRIAMYPLVPVIATGILARDARVRAYALPLCLAGLGLAVYHNLLY